MANDFGPQAADDNAVPERPAGDAVVIERHEERLRYDMTVEGRRAAVSQFRPGPVVLVPVHGSAPPEVKPSESRVVSTMR